jgi:hypothetical protein
MTWKSGMPELIGGLWNADKFLRKDDARKVGLSKGLGVPFMYERPTLRHDIPLRDGHAHRGEECHDVMLAVRT